MSEGQTIQERLLSPESIVRPAWIPLGNYPDGTVGSQIFPQVLNGRERAQPLVEKVMKEDVPHHVYRNGHMRARLREEGVLRMHDLLNGSLDNAKLSTVISSQDFVDSVQRRLTDTLLSFPHATLARQILYISHPFDEVTIPTEPAQDTELRQIVDAEVLTLPDDLAMSLILSRGLDQGVPRGITKVGEIYGISREKIRQREASAIKRLRSQKDFIQHVDELLTPAKDRVPSDRQ